MCMPPIERVRTCFSVVKHIRSQKLHLEVSVAQLEIFYSISAFKFVLQCSVFVVLEHKPDPGTWKMDKSCCIYHSTEA